VVCYGICQRFVRVPAEKPKLIRFLYHHIVTATPEWILCSRSIAPILVQKKERRSANCCCQKSFPKKCHLLYQSKSATQFSFGGPNLIRATHNPTKLTDPCVRGRNWLPLGFRDA
jgi:hypothetical protein